MELPDRSGSTRPAGEMLSDDAALALLEGGEPSGEEAPPPRVPQERQAAPPPRPEAPSESEAEDAGPESKRPADDDNALREIANRTDAARKADAERTPPPPDDATQRARHEELILARRAVSRFGAPKELIDSMPEDQLLDWGRRATEMQAGIDAMRARSAPPAQQNTAPRDTEPPAKPTETPRTQAVESAASAPAGGAYEANLKTAATQFAEVLGADPKDGQVIEGLLRSFTQPLRDEISALSNRDSSRDNRDKARDAALIELAVRDSMRRLEGMFPQLAEAGPRATVRSKAEKLMESGQYGNLDDAVEDAARIELFAPAMQAAAAQASKVARAKERGSVTVPSQRAAQPRALTPAEIEDRELEMLESGYSVSEVESSKALGW